MSEVEWMSVILCFWSMYGQKNGALFFNQTRTLRNKSTSLWCFQSVSVHLFQFCNSWLNLLCKHSLFWSHSWWGCCYYSVSVNALNKIEKWVYNCQKCPGTNKCIPSARQQPQHYLIKAHSWLIKWVNHATQLLSPRWFRGPIITSTEMINLGDLVDKWNSWGKYYTIWPSTLAGGHFDNYHFKTPLDVCRVH